MKSNILSPFRAFSRPARLFLLALLFDGLLFSGWNLFFNFFILEAGFGRDFLGMVNAIPSVAGLIFGVPMGLLSDRMGRKRAMIVGFLVASAAMVVQITVRQPAVMLVMGFIWGAAAQLYVLSHAPFMMKVSDPGQRDLLFSLSFGMFPLASAVGSLVAGYLPGMYSQLLGVPPESAEAYYAVLMTSLVSSLLVLAPILFIREPKTAANAAAAGVDQPAASKTSIWKALLRPRNLRLALPNLLIGFGAATLIPYMNVFFAERHSMGDSTLGVLFSVLSLITGAATFIGPRLVGNLGGKVRVVVLGQLASLGFLLLIGFSPLVWLAVFGFLMRGALMNMTAPLFDAYAMEQTPENEQGMVNSLRGLAWNVGWAVGPYISGLVQERFGFAPLFISTGVLYGLASLITWLFFGRVRQPAPQPCAPCPETATA